MRRECASGTVLRSNTAEPRRKPCFLLLGAEKDSSALSLPDFEAIQGQRFADKIVPQPFI
jgi:hypothetical protein